MGDHGRADAAAGAAAIVDHDRLAELAPTTSAASERAKLSLGPPAGKGTTQVMVFSGQSPARAAPAAASPSAPPSAVRRVTAVTRRTLAHAYAARA